MATEADLIQKFKDLNIPVGADFEELIHAAFASSNLADQINSKADDSKVVHTADMRKPASDVAGIDEVSTKQDKIGYTPADDSKVVHDNHDGTITANNLTYDLSKSGLTSLQIVNSGSFNDLPLGTVFANSSLTDGPDTIHSYTTTTFYFSDWSGRKVQIAIADNTNLMYFRIKILSC